MEKLEDWIWRIRRMGYGESGGWDMEVAAEVEAEIEAEAEAEIKAEVQTEVEVEVEEEDGRRRKR